MELEGCHLEKPRGHFQVFAVRAVGVTRDALGCLLSARAGSQVIVPYRCVEDGYKHLKLCGDLGQVGLCPIVAADTVCAQSRI